jgi:tetratricopeptide (TPR) repeat protein
MVFSGTTSSTHSGAPENRYSNLLPPFADESHTDVGKAFQRADTRAKLVRTSIDKSLLHKEPSVKPFAFALVIPAVSAFQGAINPVELITKSAQLQREERVNEAMQVIDQLLAMPSLSPLLVSRAWNEAGLAHQTKGDYALAERAYRKAKKILEIADLEVAYGAKVKMNLIALWIETGQLEKAYLDFAKLDVSKLREEADISQALSLKASISFSRNDLALARATFLEQVNFLRKVNLPELQVDLATALNNLGAIASASRSWAEAGQLLSEALEVQRRVSADRHPNSFTILCGLAMVRMRERQHDKAIEIWEHALGAAKTMSAV